MQKIKTRDGSYTFINEEYDESYHCKTIGALEEAYYKYVDPSGIKENDNVLDFCFGLGYNTIAALKVCPNINVTALELDTRILSEILTNIVPDNYKEQNKVVQQAVFNLISKGKDEKINIIIGRAEDEIKKLQDNTFNVILFDPFSPGKHKELWSIEVFKECYRTLKPKGKLTTYSCAKWVRQNMKEAGFEIIDGPVFGRNSPSTVAVKS